MTITCIIEIHVYFVFSRPKDFIECEEPIDHKGNKTAKDETGFGCVKVF